VLHRVVHGGLEFPVGRAELDGLRRVGDRDALVDRGGDHLRARVDRVPDGLGEAGGVARAGRGGSAGQVGRGTLPDGEDVRVRCDAGEPETGAPGVRGHDARGDGAVAVAVDGAVVRRGRIDVVTAAGE